MSGFRLRTRGEDGQVIALVAIALVAMIALVGLVIDGANAFAQQREAQNAADAAANAGALRLAQNLPFTQAGKTPPNGDAEVFTAVSTSAEVNGVDPGDYVGYYTSISGDLLTNAGVVTTDTAQAAIVGDGDSLLAIPSGAAGVRVGATEVSQAFFTSVVGISIWNASAEATAVAGYINQVARGTVLPVTIPVNIYTCQNTGTVTFPTDEYGDRYPWPEYPPDGQIALPLCKDGPGNVGWLDWTPPGGGNSELVDAILTASNGPIDIPSWQYVMQTGNALSGPVEDALNSLAGQIVLIPMFDETCEDDPGGPTLPCPGDPGQGSNLWYHIPYVLGFELNSPVAASAKYSTCSSYNFVGDWNGAGCLIGRFVYFIGPVGRVSGSPSPGSRFEAVGVQLIR